MQASLMVFSQIRQQIKFLIKKKKTSELRYQKLPQSLLSALLFGFLAPIVRKHVGGSGEGYEGLGGVGLQKMPM